jgi:hypothetical protein
VRGHDDFVACWKIDGIRRPVVEHVTAFADVAPCFGASSDGDGSGEDNDAKLVAGLVHRYRITASQAIRRKADVLPSGGSRRHVDDLASLAARFDEKAHDWTPTLAAGAAAPPPKGE